ncbi:MAG: DUF3592 domain-containing protein [Polyangiaceae bacterium]
MANREAGGLFRHAAGEVPPAPREVTNDMRADAASAGRLLRIFGPLWTTLSLVAIVTMLLAGAPLAPVFPVLGVLAVASTIWLLGLRARASALTLYREGQETIGFVESVERDYRRRVNRMNPWVVRYRYETEHGERTGSVSVWMHERPSATVGQRLVIVFDPKHPARSAVWTRLAFAQEQAEAQAAAEEQAPVRVRVDGSAPRASEEAATEQTEFASDDDADDDTADDDTADDAAERGSERTVSR